MTEREKERKREREREREKRVTDEGDQGGEGEVFDVVAKNNRDGVNNKEMSAKRTCSIAQQQALGGSILRLKARLCQCMS